MSEAGLVQWVEKLLVSDLQAAVIIGVVAVAAIVGLYGAVNALRYKHTIESTPTSKVRSATPGYVELIGEGQPNEGAAIHAPLSDMPCIWYEYKVEEYRPAGTSHTWSTVASGTSEEVFVLKDETGACIVDPDDALVITGAAGQVWYGNSREGCPPTEKSVGWAKFLEGQYRYTERCISPGDRLYALGMFESAGGGALPVMRKTMDYKTRPYILSTGSQSALIKRSRNEALFFAALSVLASALVIWMIQLKMGMT